MAAIPLENPLVQSYIVYSAILALKLLAMANYTGLVRIAKGIFISPEDTKFLKRSKVSYNDPMIERIRRAHLNDLENIPAFWILGALYLTTGPSVAWGTMLFRVYTAGRIIHSFVYAVVPLPQPARIIAYLISYFVMCYMGIQTILYYVTAL